MWNFKCTIISVITGAAGIVTRSVRKNLDRYTRETFDRFTTKESYTRNITHNMESTAVRWDHLWFVRSNRKKRSVTRDDNYSNSNSRNNNNNNNNNNKGSRGMGEVAPLYGVDSALVLTNPGVQ